MRILSAPDCVDAANFVNEFKPAPKNVTYMRVQHVGDPGTAELEGETANAVTWDVGQFTGLSVSPSLAARTQRGYRNDGPPNPASAFQLACNGAGFLLNSRRFSHASPIVLAGPVVSVARDLVPGAHVFRNATAVLVIEGTLRVPYMLADVTPLIEGTAQVSLFYYARDLTTNSVFAHVIALYDNRSPGVYGAGHEALGADAFTPFVTSPLARKTAAGAPPEFVSVDPGSSSMQFVEPWAEARQFRAHVTYAQFKAMLARLIRDATPAASPRPEDYRVVLFGVLAEIFPGTGTLHEVALGGSVVDLVLAETYRDVTPVPVVEFHHAQRDHHFISARADEIAALDAAQIPDWRRTGNVFHAWPVYVEGASRVCRFYLPPAYGDSHFFSAFADECRSVAERYPGFVLEDAEAFYVLLPDVSSGACAGSSDPVFRMWNGRSDTNHRYTTDAGARQAMLAAGWISEGYGPSGVGWCAPRPTLAAVE